MTKPTYTIQIDEDQRLALLALIGADTDHDVVITREEHPLVDWFDMLTGLPDNEKRSPKVVHSFCS